MKIKCLAFDFDGTLAHFVGGKRGLATIFHQAGVPPGTFLRSYRTTRESGFTIEGLVKYLRNNEGIKLSLPEIKREVNNWTRQALRPYPDTLFAIKKFKNAGLPTAIVSRGSPVWQKQKIKISGIAVDCVFFVGDVGKKPQALKRLLCRYGSPLLYVDDWGQELDAVRKSFPAKRVGTRRILRPDSPHLKERPKFQHKEIHSLLDLNLVPPFQ